MMKNYMRGHRLMGGMTANLHQTASPTTTEYSLTLVFILTFTMTKEMLKKNSAANSPTL